MESFWNKKPKPNEATNKTADSIDIPEQTANASDATDTNETLGSTSHVHSNIPSDISRIGDEKKEQNLSNHQFKKHADGRSFQAKWLQIYSWLEYSKEKNAAFCYACRQFGLGNTNDVFTTTGYDNWHSALSKGKGLKKHECTEFHKNSMLSWAEKTSRINTNQQVTNILNASILEKRRYYLKGIISTILFLAKNELPLRGDWNSEGNKEFGLFQALFERDLEKDEFLRHCQRVMPENAKYTSPLIQNEVIQIISDMLREKIVSEINNSTYLTLLADGTKDKNGQEIISISFRYIKDGKPVETLIGFWKAEDISAKGITALIVDKIVKYGIAYAKIICQCYDGAFVMSGDKGGVQTLLQQHFNMKIPYVHCFNHRLHLVVVDVIKEVEWCRLFFDQVKLLHKFFNRFKVRREYEGTNIPRLIETRWSGHLNAIKVILENYVELLNALEKIKNGNGINFDADDIALAAGILNAMMEKKFLFMLQFMYELLNLIEPANKILQSREVGFGEAQSIINIVREKVVALRDELSFNRLLNLAEDQFENFEVDRPEPRPQRTRQRSSRLTGSIVYETLGERHIETETGLENANEREILLFKSQYFIVIDRVIAEMTHRFETNIDILTAIMEVNNLGNDNFDRNVLEPLKKINLSLPSEVELKVVQKYLSKEENKKEESILKNISPVKEAVEDTYHLLEAAETFGSSTTISECSFSALARIDTVRRMAMTDIRLCNLAFIAFEKNKMELLQEDDIVKKFAEKNRRVQFF